MVNWMRTRQLYIQSVIDQPKSFFMFIHFLKTPDNNLESGKSLEACMYLLRASSY